MGSITSLVDGSTHHYSELVTVTYDSGTFDFGNGAGQIATLVFEQNGIPKATRSTQPTAAPATYSQSWALPASGATAIIRVHAKNLMGMVLETVEVTLNLDAQPAATCAGATDQAMDALTLNGNIVGIPAGGSAQFRYGTVNGGPYPDTIPAFPQAVGPTSAALTGLTAGTVYYYVLEILDASSTVVATSPQCSGQTLLDANQAGPACPVPPFVDECPPKQVYSVGGVEYISYQFCDKATNTPILVVYRLCDGEPSDLPTYYDLLGQPFTPTGAVGLCDTGLDYETLCDKGTDPNTRILALWDTSTVPPTLKYYTPGIDGSLVAYTPIGPVSDCPETDVEESQICYLAINAGAGYAAGDQLLQILFWDTGEIPPVLTSTIWRNQTQNRVMASAPTFADLVPCADKDHEVLTFCDDNGPFLRRYSISGDGSVVVTDTALDGTTAYTPVGTIKICQPSDSSDIEIVTLCDDNGPFLRFITRNVDGSITANDTQLDGVTAYLPVGTVKSCSGGDVSAPNLEDSYLVCGTVAGIQSPLIRQIILDQSGGAISEAFFTVDGVPVTPTSWTPGDCERGFQTEILCDDNGPFLRRYVRDAEGNVTSLDLLLDGSSVYVTVGTIKVCGAGGLVVGEKCYGPATATDTFDNSTFTGADEGPQTATLANFVGTGIPVVATTTRGSFQVFGLFALGTQLANTPINSQQTIDLGACYQNVIIEFAQFDDPGSLTNERLRNISPAPDSITGDGAIVGGNGVDPVLAANSLYHAFFLKWNGPVRYISFDFLSNGDTSTIAFVRQITVDNPAKVTVVLCDGCDGGLRYFDTVTGVEVLTPTFRTCPSSECAGNSDNEIVILCDNNAGTITRFLRRYVVLNGNVSTVDTTVDGQTAYAPAGTVQLCQPCGQIEVLCDDIGSFLRHYGCDGTTTDTALDGTTAYTVTGTVKRCDIKRATPIILCDDNGSFLRHLVYANDGLSATIYDTAFDGTTAYTAVGTVKRCDFAIAYQLLCDYSAGTVVPFLRRFAQAETGALVVTDTALDAVTAYTVAGTVGDCALANVDPVILCDDNGSFLRHVLYSGDGTTVTVFDTDMDGVDYTTVGTVKNCGASGRALIQACDKTTETTGNVPGACGTNQQTVDAVDIQDAEEKDVASGLEVNVNDNDLEMAGTAEAGESDHQIAVRFTMNVPQGATICNAYIQFTSRSTTSFGTLIATIRGEAADTSAPFTTTAGMLTARAKTTANVSWNVPLWPTSGQAGAAQRTPDLSTIVQEIVDRAGWVAGNNTAFIFTPGATGYRRAQSLHSGTAVAPKLHVEYVLDTPGGSTDVWVPFYKEIDLSTGLATGNNYRLNAGTWSAYTPTGTVTDSCTVQRSSTIQRQVGAGTVTVASGARSLSIVVLSGQPTVSIGAGAAVALATGISLNWGASSDKEVLTDAFSFTCAAGDDLIVTTIR